jgi:tryptophan synthase alpha chain
MSAVAAPVVVAGARRIGEAFGRAAADGRAALIPYAVAGFPDAALSERIALGLIDSGADLLEFGLPYSDPLADGATLQRASRIALAAGATLDHSLSLIETVANARPGTPIVAMGYVNQLLGGRDGGSILRRLGRAGVTGIILADLTPDEGATLQADAAAEGLAIVYLVTPTTTPDRRTFIANRTGGFLYAVSLAGVTGARTSLPPGVGKFLDEVRAVSPVPVAVGFGVSKPVHARQLAPHADGIIVASALVDALGPDGSDVARMTTLVTSLREATRLRP